MRDTLNLTIFTTLLMLTFSLVSFGQPQQINNFIVKENLTQNGKLAIIAVDSLEKPLESINGTFLFNLNGFQQDLIFHDGIAVVKQALESSNFVFFKHQNKDKSVGKLYYVHKSEKGLKPIKIYGMLLLIIPAGILLIAYAFKRFIGTFVVLALVYAYFHYSKGLDFSKIIESIFLGLKNLL